MWVTSFGNGMKKGFLYPAGINENQKQSSLLKVYPNPANEKVTIETAEPADQGVISFTNSQGQEILNIKATGVKTVVPVTNLPAGLYFVKMISNKFISVEKFIKE